ncbi:MAG: urease accessory protein UreF [Firmicutes bacterium]|nr:urease accessory protein UreF [Bacillota bacterium]
MSQKNQLFYLMQLAGGTFPSGGFSQSWGLETYVSEGRITDEDSFKGFLSSYLDSTIGRCEGPIVYEALRLAAEWEKDRIAELEELSCALKVTKESRESALRMGKAFLRITADILPDEEIKALRKCSASGMSYPVVYGLICGRLGLEPEAVLQAYVFSTVNALVQSGVKLIPLGNTQAQKILLQLQPEMEACAAECQSWGIGELSNFSPGLDIAGILHETLPVRLYMS